MIQVVHRNSQVFADSAGSANGPQSSVVFEVVERSVSGILDCFLLESAARVGIVCGMTVSPGLSRRKTEAVGLTISADKRFIQSIFGENSEPNQSSEATAINCPPSKQSQALAVPHL